MDAADRTTAFGRSMRMRGELFGDEDMSIAGAFDGIIRLPGARLTIGPEARVRANIEAQDVIVYGKVEGEIHALGTVSLRQEAMMVGDIYAAKFSMEDGTALRGTVDPTRAGDPLPELRVIFSSAAPATPKPVYPRTVTAPEAEPGNLFAAELRQQRPAPRVASMPAGLAAAARHFDEVVGSASTSTQGSEPDAEGPSALAETRA